MVAQRLRSFRSQETAWLQKTATAKDPACGRDGGRRPTFTDSGAAYEWAASAANRSGCSLDDEMSARVVERTWPQR